MNPKSPSCDLPRDPNILPVLALPGFDWLTNCTGTELAQEGSVKLTACIEGTWGIGDQGWCHWLRGGFI